MKKKQVKYLIKVLEKVQKLNNKTFDEMVTDETAYSSTGRRNGRIDDHLDDVIGILSDELDDLKADKCFE